MEIKDIIALIGVELPSVSVVQDESSSPEALMVAPQDLKSICQLLYSSDKAYFDFLSCITGIDNGPEQETMEVIYNLYSIPNNFGLMLKVQLSRKNPEVDTISDIWKTANWLERETYDLVGIHFNGHPDLRRILLPKNWEGHPLQKDYQTQEYFHGIKVDY